MKVHCKDCIYWNPSTEPGDRHGNCCRNSPVTMESVYCVWPITLDAHWCGESVLADDSNPVEDAYRKDYMDGLQSAKQTS